MQLWIARDAAVSVREQLVTQLALGILSGELAPGQRLPSTRELARRFKVHANTISAAYKQLESERWVEFRHGSGVFVCGSRPEISTKGIKLDQLIAEFLRRTRQLGIPIHELRSRVQHWLSLQPPDHFLLIEPDKELRAIVAAELRGALQMPVAEADLSACKDTQTLAGAIPVCLPSKLSVVQRALPSGMDCIGLRVRSIPASLAKYLPAKTDVLVGVASRWNDFLKPARTILLAAGFSEETLVVRDARRAGWTQGLQSTAAVVCDCVTAAQLPKECRPVVFPILAEPSFAELKRIEAFVRDPLHNPE